MYTSKFAELPNNRARVRDGLQPISHAARRTLNKPHLFMINFPVVSCVVQDNPGGTWDVGHGRTGSDGISRLAGTALSDCDYQYAVPPSTFSLGEPPEGQVIMMVVDSLWFSHYSLFIIYFGLFVFWRVSGSIRREPEPKSVERSAPVLEFPPNLAVRRFISK